MQLTPGSDKNATGLPAAEQHVRQASNAVFFALSIEHKFYGDGSRLNAYFFDHTEASTREIMKTPKTKMRYPSKTISVLALAFLMSACGGGGDSSPTNGGENVAASTAAPDAQVVTYLRSSNIDFAPGANGRPDGTWRWPGTPAQHVTVYLPLPSVGNATESDYANKVAISIQLINTKLSGLLTLDLTNTRPAAGNFIEVSYLTSWVPPGSTDYASYCANVATGPNTGSMIVPDASNSISSGPVYVNLGNGHCNVTQDIVTHEFGHALGLANHFASFGDAPVNAWTSAYFDVLATLYGNPQSTSAANLVVKRAKN